MTNFKWWLTFLINMVICVLTVKQNMKRSSCYVRPLRGFGNQNPDFLNTQAWHWLAKPLPKVKWPPLWPTIQRAWLGMPGAFRYIVVLALFLNLLHFFLWAYFALKGHWKSPRRCLTQVGQRLFFNSLLMEPRLISGRAVSINIFKNIKHCFQIKKRLGLKWPAPFGLVWNSF